MPFIVPFLPLIAAGVGAAGIGTSIYEGDKSADASSAATAAQQKAALQQQQAQANQANLSKQEAVLGAQGQAQEQTGGSLTDPGTASITDLLAGYPGYQAGGTGTGTSTGTGVGPSGVAGGTATPTPAATGAGGGTGTPDIAGLLAALRGGGGGADAFGSPSSISGGNWQAPFAQPQAFQQLANPVI